MLRRVPRLFVAVLATAAVALNASPVSPAQAAEKINSIIAIVNDRSISRIEMEKQEAEVREQAAAQNRTLSDHEIRKQALDALIYRLLQLQEAERIGIRIPDRIVDERINDLRTRWGATSDRQLQQLIQTQFGSDLQNFRSLVKEQMTIDQLFHYEIFRKTDVYDEEVSHFLQTETDLGSLREYRLRHILISQKDDESREDALARITQIRAQIVSEETSFADAAREFSSDSNSAPNGGDLFWRTAERLPADFVSEAQNLKPGGVSAVIETGRGFHILMLEGVRGGKPAEGNVSRVKLAHILLPENSQGEARRLRNEIANGGDFAELARQYSIDERSKSKGGVIDAWFQLDEMPDYFAGTEELSEGEVSEPIVSPFGVHLVQMVERDEFSMEQARERARKILRERRALAQRLDWLQQLRGRAYIVVVDPEYGGLTSDFTG